MARNFKSFFVFFIIFIFHTQSESQDLAVLQNTTNLGLLTEAQEKNKYGQDKYAMDAALMSKQSVIRYSNGSECLASCPDGCCAGGESLIAEAAMYSLLGIQANIQAQEHQKSAKAACQIYNQLSTEKKNCKAEVSEMNNFVPQPIWYDSDGNCQSNAPKECAFMEQFKFGDIYKAKGAAQVCGIQKNEPCGGMQSYFKGIQFNKDNSVSIKINGRSIKLNLNDFSDPKYLKNLGFSAEIASNAASTFLIESNKLSLASALSQTAQSNKIQNSTTIPTATNSLDSNQSIIQNNLENEIITKAI